LNILKSEILALSEVEGVYPKSEIMKIRTRLTLHFLVWGVIIMFIASATIYYTSANYRKEDFYSRLKKNGLSSAKLLLDANVIDPGRVLKMERDNPVKMENEKIIILNFLDDVIYSTDSTNEIKIINSVLERVRLLEKVTYRQGKYRVVGTLYPAKLDRFVIIAAATDTDGHFYLQKLAILLFLVFSISLILFFLAGWIYAGKALSPISKVIKSVEEVSVKSLHLRVPVIHKTDEIGQLAGTFNKMLERLDSSFKTQKEFISNASHELRTPLTAINGQLEVLMLKDRSSSEYKTEITSVLGDIRSMIDLLNRLLLIARTSSEGIITRNEKVRVDEVLWQAKDELKKYNNDFQIRISVGSSVNDANQLVVNGDESLLKAAVSNVMENGCKYSPDHSVNVNVEFNNNIEIQFHDHGIGISEDDLKKVFEPFYRAVNAKAFPGTGIGLQIVNQVIKAHNGAVTIASEAGKGTVVTIILPSVF
jgi:signal transduction histidine kinase